MRNPSLQRTPIHRARRATLHIAAAALALALLSGCFESSTEPDTSDTTAAPADIATLGEIQLGIDLTEDQAAALVSAHTSWKRTEAEWARTGQLADEPPVFAFVATSAGVLNRGQLTALIANLHGLEAVRMAVPSVDASLLASPRRDQGGPGRHGHRGWRHPRHNPFADLDLSAEQIEAIRAAQRTLRDTIHDLARQLRDGSLTAEQFEAGVEEARAAYETALQTTLTAEQYAQLQAARRDRLIAGLEARLAAFDAVVGRHVRALDRILDLDDTQVAAVNSILTNTRPQFAAVLAGLQDGSMTPQEASDALKQIAIDTAAAIRATLTEEQAAIFDRLKHLRRPMPC